MDHLKGKEITSAGHLSAQNFSFGEEIIESDGKLNFYLQADFDVDAAFGTFVCTDQNDDWLNNALEQQPIDEDNAKALILRLVAEQYAALGDEEYETNRLRRLFSAFECVAELNADLLKNTVPQG